MNPSYAPLKQRQLPSRSIHVLPDLALTITWTPSGLHSITFHPTHTRTDSLNDSHLPAFVTNTVSLLRTYFDGTPTAFSSIPLDLTPATPFQRNVWSACRTIPWGRTRSYGWIARQIRKPAAARPVGNALRLNPIPILIPCHRVIRHDGSLGGFSAGLHLKRQLLQLENRHAI